MCLMSGSHSSRKLEADNIRASHMQAPAPKVKARPREGRQQPHKTQPAASSSAPKARARPRDGRQQPHNTQPAASSSKAMPAISTPTPSRRTYVSDSDRHDEDEDEDVESDGSLASDAIGRPGVLNSSVFPARVLRVGTMCKGCGLYDCPSCACMCEGSPLWIDHPGGHFFRDCKKCGGTECPGCACVCIYSTVWTEHGGHVVGTEEKRC
jgi:hypothetical protein